MEKPYSGRAIWKDTLSGTEIEIPAKKNWLIVIFLGGWLVAWFVGLLFTSGMLIGNGLNGDGPPGFFILFWLIIWTTGGFFAVRTFLWFVAGKELLRFERGQLSVGQKGMLFAKTKIYDLNEVKNIRVAENGFDNAWAWGYQRNGMFNLGASGTIKFDYGLKTIKIADVDEAEARYIITRLKEAGILKD